MYRILLIGDYSNMHSQLAASLTAMGHEVTLMSDGCGFMDTARNIDVTRRPGRIGGLALTLRCLGPLHRHMRGYDIVALQNPHFLSLRPQRLRYFFDRLRGENRAVFLTAAGTDTIYLREALDPQSPLRYNEFRIADRPTPFAAGPGVGFMREWLSEGVAAFDDYVYDHIDGAVSALYEYHVAVSRRLGADRVAYGGIPVDTASLKPVAMETPQVVRLFLGRHRGRQAEKGTDLLEQAARTVCARHPGCCELRIVENRPYGEYVGLMRGSHLVLDQIYSYTPATNAMIAMAQGIPAVSGGEPDYYKFIGEENGPVINAPVSLDELTETIDGAVTQAHLLPARGAASREFVCRHNDAAAVARRFLSAWERWL